MPRPPLPDEKQEPQLFHVQKFGGINTQSQRSAIGEEEFAWLENYVPIGPGNMRTLWSNGAAIYTAPGGTTIIYTYFFNLAAITQVAVFLSDGTAVQVNTATSAQVSISGTANFFYNGGSLPAAVQWTASGILIVTEAQGTQGYFAWDGTTLFGPGSAAPNWLTNSTPTFMPAGVHGSCIEIYQSRVWIGTPPTAGVPSVLFNSGPGNGATFSTPAGGGAAPQQDSSLRYTFTQLRQSNGFLYYWGDSSIGVISNVQSSGSPVVTTYNNQNVDPQVGTSWPGSVQAFGAALIFANAHGVFALLGGTVQKISHQLDGIFAQINFAAITALNAPTGAVANIFGVKVYMLRITAPDQTGTSRSFMVMWNGDKWWVGSQDATLALIASQESNSVLSAWGSSGTTLFQMFTTASATLAKSSQSKFWAGGEKGEGYIFFKKVYRFYFQAIDNAGSGITFTGTIDSDFANANLNVSSLTAVNNSGGVLQAQNLANQNIYPVTFGIIAATTNYYEFTNASGQIIHFTNSSGGTILWGKQGLVVTGLDMSAYGRLIGATLGSLSTDFTLVAYTLLYSLDAPYLG